MEFGIVGGVVAAVVAIGLVLYVVITYNEFVRLRNDSDRAWANIDVLLKQRHDEVPNLVDTVKGYMHYEKETLLAVTEARVAALAAASISQKAEADVVLTGALRSFFGVAEKYPQLKANENFLKLQERISGLEERIADRREYFNNDVNTYNMRLRQFPEIVLAAVLRLKPREMFKASEADSQPVSVNFAQLG